MTGYSRIQVSTDKIYVRFERVEPPGPPGTFDALRDRFYHSVLSARWDHHIRWMVVPVQDLSKVVDFCYREFGVIGTKITSNNPSVRKSYYYSFKKHFADSGTQDTR